MSSVPKKPQLSILLLLISFPAAASTIFAPALPAIAEEFMISVPTTQMLVTIYLIGITIGQLIYGPLSNRFGRKYAIYTGILLAITGIVIVILAAFIHSYKMLLIGRFITALGASVGMVMNFILIRDSFSSQEARRVISFTLMLSALVPGISAAIGGLLVEVFNWKMILYFLLVYSAGLILICLYLPETCQQYDSHSLNLLNILAGYVQQFRHYKLIIGAIIMGGNTTIIHIFSAVSPFIVIQYMQQSPELYGKFMIIPSIGFLLGALISSTLTKVAKTTQTITLGLSTIFAGAFFMFVNFWVFTPALWSLFASMFFIFLGIAICYSNTSILTLEYASNASNGSAIIAFINSAVSMLSVSIVQILNLTETCLLPIIFLSIIFTMTVLYLCLTRVS